MEIGSRRVSLPCPLLHAPENFPDRTGAENTLYFIRIQSLELPVYLCETIISIAVDLELRKLLLEPVVGHEMKRGLSRTTINVNKVQSVNNEQ